LPLALTAALVVPSAAWRSSELPTTIPNPNTAPAGTLRDGVLSLELDAVEARWHDGAGAVPGSSVLAFAERGRQPTIPGPLLRVPAGTLVRVSVHNTLARPITFFLPTSPATDDSVIVAAGATGDLAVRAATPGNFIYRATSGPRDRQLRVAGALAGAMVVDSASAHGVPGDRVLVMQTNPDSAIYAGLDTGATLAQVKGTFAFTINGLSWPHTERFAAMVGDTVHWRVINASFDTHPMHLHGFYYRVDEFTGLFAARDGQGEPGRLVVTERMSAFSAMRMTWSPERPGNWLMHCHFSLHLVPPAATTSAATADDASVRVTEHDNHALTGMVGLVVGITVQPRAGDRAVAGARGRIRRLRLLVVSDSGFPERRPSQRFVIEEDGRRTTSSHPGMSPTLYLTRNEPVSITVVNQLSEHTAIHWHGMELESYFDGVAGLSGSGTHIAPTIAPGDSFVARFTPPRAGTFMYHSHVDDVRQQRAGLVGAMIVRDGPATAAPDDYEIFLKGAMNRAPTGSPLEIGGVANPDTLVIRAGRPARFRFMSLTTSNASPAVVITTRADSVAGNVRDTLVASWVPLAKDGADLPASARQPRPARQIISMGETYDFAFTPPAAGSLLRLEVRGGGGPGALLGRVPIRVE
jgi:FtsP/CotA-like multicopper oxidase with cupredoxin domain